MDETLVRFTADIPQHYDSGLGPHIFIDFGTELARRTAAHQPRAVLELAAGTGIVTEILVTELSASSRITATDLNPPMLEIARAKLRASDNVELRPADATALPFSEGSFDSVVCQFGVMFFPDKEQSFREVYRVLRSGGRYLFNVWDAMEHNPFSRVAQETIASFFADDPPQFYKLPFSYCDAAAIAASLADTGFENIETEVIRIDKEVADPELFARGLVYGNPAIEEIRGRSGASPDEITAAVVSALERELDGAGQMPLQAIFVSARKA